MFYDNYIRLCEKVGKSPSAVAIENGITKSNVTYWKKGRNMPSDVTLAKLAAYFGCTVSDLKEDVEQKEKPSAENDTELDETTKELVELAYSLDEEDRVMLLEMARSIKKRRES